MKIIILLSILLLSFSSCINTATNKRSLKLTASTLVKSSVAPASFATTATYLQNGSVTSSMTMPLSISFIDSLWLKGKSVDYYLRNQATAMPVLCALYSVNNFNVMMALQPKSFYNANTQSNEFYFSFSPNDEVTNQNNCGRILVSNKTNYLYALSKICQAPACMQTAFTTQAMEVYNPTDSLPVTVLYTNQLILNLSNNPSQATNASTSVTSQNMIGCASNAECIAQKLDCCSAGLCIKNLSLKTGVITTAPDYIQALSDILSTPGHVVNYPQFYNICLNANPATSSLPAGASASSAPVLTASATASLDLSAKLDLYNCTSKLNGEMGICSIVIKNPALNTYYNTRPDDLSFASTYTNQNTNSYTPSQAIELSAIQSVEYGRVTLFDYNQYASDFNLRGDEIIISSALKIKGIHNDDNTSVSSVMLTALPPDAINTDLIIRYRVNASCTKLSPTLIRCEKYYIQGKQFSGASLTDARMGRVTDHYPASNEFIIPTYANTSQLKMEVDGVVKPMGVFWQVGTSASGKPAAIVISPNKILDGQTVRLTYYSNDLAISTSKDLAQKSINSMCGMAATGNGLFLPIKDNYGTIIDFKCGTVPPQIAPTATFTNPYYLSSKSAAHRFFDSAGVPYPLPSQSTLPQEGNALSYTNNNLAQPNNIANYIGINEIMGSITNSLQLSAKAPLQIAVNKNKYYDINAILGNFQTCASCGNNYYTKFTSFYPLTAGPAGLIPLQSRTNPFISDASSVLPDDFSYGRACFVPPTMIANTHGVYIDASEQRKRREAAQHFLYANGMNRDWYGFNYGSVIGSFDGVKWFSIGTKRRIKAESNILFLAINAPLSDLVANESTYNISIVDTVLANTGYPESDYDSDGASCQQFHQCSTDQDCYTSLGPDYTCNDVTQINTLWPAFDDAASEQVGSSNSETQLTRILGANFSGPKTNASNKRCVYRGRGSLCHKDNSDYCSASNHCETFLNTTGGFANNFNNRILRQGQKILNGDTFGRAMPIAGRPYSAIGQEPINTMSYTNFQKANFDGICVPGKNMDLAAMDSKMDRVLGLGFAGANLNSCAVFDDLGNYYTAQNTNDPSANARGQFLNSSTVEKYSSVIGSLLSPTTTILSGNAWEKNRCVKAPGASCFSDFECAPNFQIAGRIKSLGANSALKDYEQLFWQEELICSNSKSKNDPLYNSHENRCCRDINQTITIPSSDIWNNLDTTNPSKYSRVATVYKEMTTDPINFPALNVPNAMQSTCTNNTDCFNPGNKNLKFQAKTLNLFGQKTSCSGNWVRSKLNSNPSDFTGQAFSVSMFRCYNWDNIPTTATSSFSCLGLDPNSPDCVVISRKADDTQSAYLLDYLARLNLLGIGQVELDNPFNSNSQNWKCTVNPLNQKSDTAPLVPPFLFSSNLTGASGEIMDINVKKLSAINPANFQNNMKQIFKSDEIRTCLPAGSAVPAGTNPLNCCTGFINGVTNTCALQDFSDVSLYTNRLVSSEGAKLADNNFDDAGYVNNIGTVYQMACEKRMCASNKMALGVLISPLKIPGLASSNAKISRFLEGATDVDDLNGLLTLYNAGVRLNNHLYCIPAATTSSTNDLTIFTCN